MVIRMKKRAVMLACVAIVMILAACGTQTVRVERTVFALDTFVHVQIYGARAEEAMQMVVDEVHRFERLFSPTDARSDVRRVNDGAGAWVEVAPETLELLEVALDLFEQTEGTFSPALGTLIAAWGFQDEALHMSLEDQATIAAWGEQSEALRVPLEDELADLLEAISVGEIVLGDGMVFVPIGTALDFGGIAKGYMARVLMERLQAYEIDAAMISLGGDVSIYGTRAGGAAWRIALEDPLRGGRLGVLTLSDTSIHTSGRTERYLSGADGARFHHILDPRTGFPAGGDLLSVAVVAEDAVLGDALATALLVMGLDRARAFVDGMDGVSVILVTLDGVVYASASLRDVFELEREGTVRLI